MKRHIALCCGLLFLAAPAAAQLPDAVADSVTAALNDPTRLRLVGSATIAPGDTIRADVVVLDGPLVLGGHVRGDLTMVNGEVRFLTGASVEGTVRIVGGYASGAEGAVITGRFVVHPEPLRFRKQGDVYVRVRPAEVSTGIGSFEWGQGDFLLATGNSYNRVEGLPVTFGPRVRTAGSNPLRLHALAIYRTEAGASIDTDAMGYMLQAEQFMGGHREWMVGARAHSRVEAIEDWHMTDLESGLSTLLLHRDFRDHYERVGGSLLLSWEPRRTPWQLTGELRRDRHRPLVAGSPFTLFRNAEPWREQPLVAAGYVTSARLSGEWDTRSDPVEPATGWYVRGHIDQALSSSLARPVAFAADSLTPRASSGEQFGYQTTGVIDVRSYNRVDPRSRLNFRLVAGGALDGDPLPPQYQHALGGEGTLPGYDLFRLDCGARNTSVFDADGEPFFPAYGCDTFALLQAEFRGRMNLRIRWDSAPWLDRDDDEGIELSRPEAWEFAPEWTVFMDAARGWQLDGPNDEDLAVDVGVGLVYGRIGAYAAVPLTGPGGLNLFVRLSPRF